MVLAAVESDSITVEQNALNGLHYLRIVECVTRRDVSDLVDWHQINDIARLRDTTDLM